MKNLEFPYTKTNLIIATFMGWRVEKLPIDTECPTQQWLKTTDGESWHQSRCVQTSHSNFEKEVERVSNEMLDSLSRYRCGKYHSDWNSLMPVVGKIESLGYYLNWFGKSDYVAITTGEDGGNAIVGFTGKIRGLSKIESIYYAVIDFIKWYSLQN